MRRVNLPPRPIGAKVGDVTHIKWLEDCLREFERASQATVVEADDFTVSNHTNTRTLDASTATLADVKNVLCTLIADMKKRGMKAEQ